MSEILLTVGLAGALLCLVGHLPGPVHRWGPQLLALAGMALMTGHRASSGVWAVVAAGLWSAVRACLDRRIRAEVIDLAAMALLMALMVRHASGSPAHMAAGMAAGPAALTVIGWVTARAAGIMFRQLSDHPLVQMTPKATPSALLARVYRETGTAIMIISMAALFV
jgi:hypothetical protein